MLSLGPEPEGFGCQAEGADFILLTSGLDLPLFPGSVAPHLLDPSLSFHLLMQEGEERSRHTRFG